MRKTYFKFLAVLISSTFLLGCIGQKEHIIEEPEPKIEESELEVVISLPHLNFELETYIGEKVWVSGFYGDDRFTDDGVGFLVSDFDTLMINESLPLHSFARLDGDLPPYEMNSAEILVYGEIKDFAETYNVFTLLPTPLITVEEYHMVTPPAWGAEISFSSSSTHSSGLFRVVRDYFIHTGPNKGTRAKKCDRAIIICGGSDKNNERRRYKEDITAKYTKLKELGFSDDQIDVLYHNKGDIKVGGANVVDSEASKQKIKEILEKYINEMPASCTLTIFVTGHGAGYNPKKGYRGAKPDEKDGKTYDEKKTYIDLRKKVHRATGEYKNPKGESFFVNLDKETSQLQLYKKENGKWVLKGSDKNKDGSITETETGQDIDGDGDTDNVGFSTSNLGPWRYEKNEWDTDGVGGSDVKAEWNSNAKKYEVYRKKDTEWKKMGEDKNGDFKIDEKDGGIDWNCDGDTNDKVGFHEGISLWKNEVLWDDEFAAILKSLHGKGIHILVEMMQCFSGGFIKNLEGIVEEVVTATDEDRYSYSYHDATGKDHDYFEKAFAENLDGIDKDSWDKAFEEAKKADDSAWEEWKKKNPGKSPEYYEEYRNKHQKWEKPSHQSESMFSEEDGNYIIVMEIPESLKGMVYDVEILFGLQTPPWEQGTIIEIPPGYSKEEIPGGIRIKSRNPFPSSPVVFRVIGTKNTAIRIELTDRNHTNLGYTVPRHVSHSLLECTLSLSTATALEYKEADLEEKENLLNKPETQYIEDMKADLLIYIRSTHPSVTEEMRQCARTLLDYLNSDSVTQKEKEQIARLYWENFKAVLSR